MAINKTQLYELNFYFLFSVLFLKVSSFIGSLARTLVQHVKSLVALLLNHTGVKIVAFFQSLVINVAVDVRKL